MNHLLFIEAMKSGEIMVFIVVGIVILFLPLFIAYRFGYYKGKDAARKENDKTTIELKK